MNPTTAALRYLLSVALFIFSGLASPLIAAELEQKPADPFFEKFAPVKAPAPGKLLLQPGDRLAICGDSITEQKMYSRLIETHLTVCVPDLKITARQYGWSGETAWRTTACGSSPPSPPSATA
ncbi:MAG: hypothetical protein ABSH20_24850 [Tepidisphaeraceae bacterium]